MGERTGHHRRPAGGCLRASCRAPIASRPRGAPPYRTTPARGAAGARCPSDHDGHGPSWIPAGRRRDVACGGRPRCLERERPIHPRRRRYVHHRCARCRPRDPRRRRLASAHRRGQRRPADLLPRVRGRRRTPTATRHRSHPVGDRRRLVHRCRRASVDCGRTGSTGSRGAVLSPPGTGRPPGLCGTGDDAASGVAMHRRAPFAMTEAEVKPDRGGPQPVLNRSSAGSVAVRSTR